MALSEDDTIFARASGAGRAGVAVFRLSGAKAAEIAMRVCGRNLQPRKAIFTRFCTADDHRLIDEGIVIYFPGPGSFTGEDVVEFQTHGSPAVEDAIYTALAGAGARLAEPGEFTRRALINGKLDLAQAEALADLIDAETETQRQQALGQLGGRLSTHAIAWRDRLIAIAAPLEADIDFPDEEGVPAAVAARAGPAIDALLTELHAARASGEKGRLVREGVRIAIIGAPNAGKSSLLNRLAGTDRAIVSERAGTTRDVIDVRLDLDGVAATVFDTAGLREQHTDEIEAEGMRRSVETAKNADLRVFVVDVSRETGKVWPESQYTIEVVSRETGAPAAPGDFLLLNKIDLNDHLIPTGEAFALSAKTGAGMAEFLDALKATIRRLAGDDDARLLTRRRHVEAVDRAIPLLERARAFVASDAELAAEDVRLAARALGAITGAVDTEDLLDAIFSSFCIGK